MGLTRKPQPTKVNDSSKTKAENTMDLRAGLLRRFNCCRTSSFCFLLNMVLVFLFPTDDIGMRRNKQKVIFTTLDHLHPLPQDRAMSKIYTLHVVNLK